MKMKNKLLTAIMALGLSTSVMAGEIKVSGDSSSLLDGSGANTGRILGAGGLSGTDYDLKLQMNANFADNWSFALRDRTGNDVLGVVSLEGTDAEFDTGVQVAGQQVLELGTPAAPVSSAASATAFCSQASVTSALATGMSCAASDDTDLERGVAITIQLEAVYEIEGGMTLTPNLVARNSSGGDGFMKVEVKGAGDDVLCDDTADSAVDSCDGSTAAYIFPNSLPPKDVASADKDIDIDVVVHFDLAGSDFRTQMANEIDVIVEAEYL